MRTHRRSAAALASVALIALLLAACMPTSAPTASPTPTPAPQPTATATPSPSPSPTATPTPLPTAPPTPTPVPRYTLKRSVLPYLGIGTQVNYLMGLAGHFSDDPYRYDTVFFLEGGGYVVVTIHSPLGEGDFRRSVDSVAVADVSGTTVRKAGARLQGSGMYGLLSLARGDLEIGLGRTVNASALLAALGAPLSDASVQETEYGDAYWVRTMKFEGFEIEMRQNLDSADKDAYAIDYEMATRADLVSPGGWRIGMTAAEAVRAAEEADWFLMPRLAADGRLAELDIVLPDLYGYGVNGILLFEEDLLVSISFSSVSVGA